jgi:DNA topoisomerase I
MSILIIVESPAKCKKIEDYLGYNYKCIASYGHLRTLESLKNIDYANNFKPEFTVIENKKQQITKLTKAIQSSNEVYIATDDDREGEAIGWHLCQLFNLPIETTKRIIFHEVTKSALENAVNNPTTINMDLVYAQQARQILDLIVGFTLSPLLWKHISRKSKQGLSAGRCQSPALKLIYDNQKEINENPGKITYTINGYFTSSNLMFTLNSEFEDKEQVENFLEESINHDHIIKKETVKKMSKKPPEPFITSTLQQSCNNEYHISPKETMKICQKLYEEGCITYMRTDSKVYSKEFIKKTKDFINKDYGDKYISSSIDSLSEKQKEKKKETKKNKKEDDKKAQEAHEAIRPTDVNVKSLTSEKFTPREKKVYLLIWKNTVKSCMSDAVVNSLMTKISGPIDLQYKYSCEEIIFLGWKIVDTNEMSNPNFNLLKSIKDTSIINYNKITAKNTLKALKSHINEAKLVKLLEEKGIGRPSTFSSLVDKIQERGYVKKDNVKGKKMKCIDFELIENEIEEIETEKEFGNEQNKLIIQPIGNMVTEFLMSNFDEIVGYDYTKNMEDTLDIIAKGEHIWHKLCESCYKELYIKANELKSESKKEIKIDDNHVYMIAKYGPVIKCTDGDDISFKKVKKDIDYQRLTNGEYTLNELIDGSNDTGKYLGIYKDEKIFLKRGKFGLYVTWGDNKKSLTYMKKEEHNITYEDVIQFIEKPTNIIRNINEQLSIRNGKYGSYIYYKTQSMKKPKFLSLQGFKDKIEEAVEEDLLTWIENKYEITI